MNMIKLSDVTMKQVADGFNLSFKEKIELAKLLDKAGVDVIEIEGIDNPRIDALRIKSIATAVQNSTVAVPVQLDQESISATWSALQLAKKPRLQVVAPVSSVQMEYLSRKKPDAMIAAIAEAVAACKAVCADVEFVADDATRADHEFLVRVLETAVNAGATTVTVCDTAGTMLPSELRDFVAGLPATAVPVGIHCANTLSMADACVIASLGAGIREVKVAAYPINNASLETVVRIMAAKGDAMDATCGVNGTQLSRIMEQIARICQSGKAITAVSTTEDADIWLTAHDTMDAVINAAQKLGYDLSDEDSKTVFEAFQRIAKKKEQVSIRELDAIIASAAMQVPSTYKLDTYLISAGNAISATAHMKLTKNGEPMEGVCLGDGPIDASFQAIEKITGRHYELDDFQIQAVTEGREAMGQTVVKLRNAGKVYSGRGISTDIVGASIHAYISALNKIVYEEEEA